MSLDAGTRLGSFEIISELASGGMGDVYKAKDVELGRDVAIKVLQVADPERIHRFEQEARAASALNHPNIVTIYEIGEHHGTPFIAMEFVDGVTLRDMLAGGALPNDKLIRYATQLAEGLAKAHQAGIVHRDLKPENIIINDDGYVKILDFGLAKLLARGDIGAEVSTLARATTPGAILGTVGYMSPEQAKGEPADFRSDQFSLGAILYEMSTGVRAFVGESSAQNLTAIIEHDPELVTLLNPSVPGHLASVIDRCLAKNASDRYDSSWELAKQIHSETLVVPEASSDRHPLAAAGVAGLLAIILVMMLGLFVTDIREWVSGEAPAPRIGSLAVLPLENVAGNPDELYFVDGMTDALITNLGKVEALKVISRTSSMRFKGSASSLPDIAEQLRVEGVIEGSVLRIGERVRVSLQLIDAVTDEVVWSEVYERELEDVLALQEALARSVVDAIQIEITERETQILSSAKRVDADAHERYLLGRAQLHQRTPESFRRGIALFQDSIELDATNALAYAGLAEAHIQQAVYGFERPADVLPEAEKQAKLALALDRNSSDAHAALGRVYLLGDYNWVEAEEELITAMRLNPGHSDVHLAYGTFLAVLGRSDEALAQSERALELNPLAISHRVNLGYQLYMARRFDEAIAQFERCIASDPNYPWAHDFMAWSLARTDSGRPRALEAMQRTFLLLGLDALAEAFDPAFHGGDFEASMAEAGRRAAALRETSYIPPPAMIAWFYAEGGDRDEAMYWLEEAYRDRDFAIAGLRTDARWDPLRDDRRFQDLLERVAFPP